MKKLVFSALIVAGLSATAQVKVGNNPTTLATDANFQVEGTTTAKQFVVLKNGNVGIGTTTPNSILNVVGTTNDSNPVGLNFRTNVDNTATLSTNIGLDSRLLVDASNSSNHSNLISASLFADHFGSGTISDMRGSSNFSRNRSLGNISNAFGTYSLIANMNTGLIHRANGVYSYILNTSTGTIDKAYLFRGAFSVTSGTINEAYGLYLPDYGSNITKKWGIYSEDTNSNSFFAGSVGIGTNAPTEKLDVAGSIKMVDGNQGAGKLMVSDADGKAAWTSLATSLGAAASKWTNNVANTSVALTNLSDGTTARTAGKEFVVTDAGSVGIGISNPVGRLHINGDVSLPLLAKIRFNNGTGAYISTLGNGMQFYTGSVGSWLAIDIDGVGSTNIGPARFDRLNNRVGIGTTTPTQILSINGDFSRTINLERITTTNGIGQTLNLIAGGAFLGSTDRNGGILNLSAGISTGSGASSITFQTATPGASGTVDNTPTTKMTILGNGNVGIGTVTPNAKLEVNGIIRIGNDASATPVAGMIRFNGTKFQGNVDGTAGGWVDLH